MRLNFVVASAKLIFKLSLPVHDHRARSAKKLSPRRSTVRIIHAALFPAQRFRLAQMNDFTPEIVAVNAAKASIKNCLPWHQHVFDLPPAHPPRQYRQWVRKLDHLVESGSKKVISRHRFLSGFDRRHFDFSGIIWTGKRNKSFLCQDF
jgi:hypothetical protein